MAKSLSLGRERTKGPGSGLWRQSQPSQPAFHIGLA
ncbi:rCG34366 [Rattus norvegicus]|uniref:RCG34366 n=1 Tax=Rattus norvegicus TaxID=10116 RepID=A6HKI2_RAT|nr:rCG34366 [Rattus norvegicus]